MILSKAMTRFGLVAAAIALVLSLVLDTAGSIENQVLPMVLYGKGLSLGQTVDALIGGKLCATSEANASGEWVMQIPADSPCKPEHGEAISFTVNGQPATVSPMASWKAGGTPVDIQLGYKLTVSE